MLGLRPRPRARGGGTGGGGGGGGEEPTGGHNSAIIALGRAQNSKNGGGYHPAGGGFFTYPQTAVQMSKVVQTAVGSSVSLALDDEGQVWVSGGGTAGAGGIGIARAAYFQDDWTKVGGRRLYLRETLTNAKTGASYTQPDGPFGPVIPTVADVVAGRATWTAAAVGVCGGLCAILTTDGRVLAWGTGQYGALGNGYEFSGEKRTNLEAGEKAQYAPWWMQIEGPRQSESGGHDGGIALASGVLGSPTATYSYDSDTDPEWGKGRRPNILKGVKAMVVAEHIIYFLMQSGELWYVGAPNGAVGIYRQEYAKPDPLVNMADKTFWPAKVTAIAATKSALIALLANSEVRFVGHNWEYMAGNGVQESSGTSIRELLIPLTGPGKRVTGVVAIAKGEYSVKYLFADGTVGTCGSNIEQQQGIAGFSKIEAQQYVTNMDPAKVTVNAGGRKVIAISGSGETTHSPNAYNAPEPERQPGANGADGYVYLLDDHSVRITGLNWGYNSGEAERWEGYGVLGTGTSENSNVPVEPLGKPKRIVSIAGGAVTNMLIQEPGSPASPTVATAVAGKNVTVTWADPPGVVGQLPRWRAESGWKLILRTPQEANAPSVPQYEVTLADVDGEGKPIRTYTFVGVLPGRYELTVLSTTVQQSATITGGALKRTVGGILSVAWAALGLSEPSLLLQYQRQAPFPGFGAKVLTLSAALPAGKAITAIPVSALPPKESIGIGNLVRIIGGGFLQVFKTSATVKEGATSIPIHSDTPIATFPIGSQVQEAQLEDWRRSTPELPGSATSLTGPLVLPNHAPGTWGAPGSGWGTFAWDSGELVEVEVVGAFPKGGAYKERRRLVTVV